MYSHGALVDVLCEVEPKVVQVAERVEVDHHALAFVVFAEIIPIEQIVLLAGLLLVSLGLVFGILVGLFGANQTLLSLVLYQILVPKSE